MRPVWVALAGALAVAGCSRELRWKDEPAEERTPAAPKTDWPARARKRVATSLEPGPTRTPVPTPTPEFTPEPTPISDPGPPPTGCALELDADGFFLRVLPDGTRYVGFLPASYTGAPTRLFVGLHGCGDDAESFAEWAVNPSATRIEQDYIGISVEESSGGGCWSEDEIPLVLRAIEDVSRCVYVHQKRIVVGGYSSGGELSYVIGLRHASRFSGILVENASLSRAGDSDELIEGASRLIPIAHIAHTGDGSYPIEDVREDWDRLRSAGFPIDTAEVEGDHDGETEDWSLWLLPRMAEWESP